MVDIQHNNNITITQVTDDDYKPLSAFLASSPDDERSEKQWLDRLKFWWDNNPAYKNGHPRGIVLKNRNLILGFTGNIPTRMLWNGKEIVVANGTTWRVLPEFRKHSMDVWFKHRDVLENFVYFNSTANPLVEKILKIFKFIPYNCAPHGLYYFISKPGAMGFKSVKKSALTSYNYFCRLCYYLDKLHKNDDKLIIQKKEQFGAEIDKLWGQTKKSYLYTNIRDRDYLEWISFGKEIYYVFYKDELIGFFIINITKNKATLVDIWGIFLEFHLHHIIRYIIRSFSHYNVIIPAFNPSIHKIVKRFGLIKKNNNDHPEFYQANKELTDSHKVYFTMLQGDYGV